MKEQIVEYQTAKRLKEIGFKEPTHNYYNKNGVLLYSCNELNWNGVDNSNYASAPTQCFVMKWFRQKKIKIQIQYERIESFNYNGFWHSGILTTRKSFWVGEVGLTFEETIEMALLEALKLLNHLKHKK